MPRRQASLVLVLLLAPLLVAAPPARADAIDDYIKVEMERRHIPGLALRAAGQRVNYTTAQLFDAAVKDELKFAAGERFLYSDGGYFVLGMIIEAVSGQRYRDFLDEKFFKPLGMRSTSVIDQWRILKNRAAGYTLRDGQLMNIRRVWQMELASHYGVM